MYCVVHVLWQRDIFKNYHYVLLHRTLQFELKFVISLQMASYVDLRTFAPIVSAHPYCARESHATSCHVMHRARALRTKMNK